MRPKLGAGPIPGADFDRRTGVLIFKIGQYPLHLGGVSVARSMGRVGVQVGVVTESIRTPLSRSRYSARRFVWSTTGSEPEAELLDGLSSIGRQWARPPVLVCTDDEAAVFVGEHSDVLSEWFVLPDVPSQLPRALADKEQLQQLCHRHGFPTAKACFPTTHAEVAKFATTATFPVMVKNARPWIRLQAPAVPANTAMDTPEQLLDLAATWREPFSVSLQEYLPIETSEDWIFHGYVARDGSLAVGFTGVKLRSWPPHSGVTTYARAIPNRFLANQAASFLQAVGYRGIVDQDWRFDRRDGQYKLLDCNPRVGNQFLLFENGPGVNVVRAMHLDLTGRNVPGGRPRVVGLKVEHLDLAAYVGYRGFISRQANSPAWLRPGGPSALGWWAPDDVRPFVSVLTGSIKPGLELVLRPGVDLVRHPLDARRAARRTPNPGDLSQSAETGATTETGRREPAAVEQPEPAVPAAADPEGLMQIV